MLGLFGMWETVAILAVVLILFGARKLPELAKGLGSGIKEFRKATREVNQDLQKVFEEEPPAPAPRRKIPTDSDPKETASSKTDSSS